MTLRERIADRVLVNLSCAFWFVTSAKITGTLIVWFAGESVVWFV